ncbi:MAG: Hint domain-containing protein [Cypionkella sp.]|nr:Hint domain-containing protein [Cypionkella sp.]
MPIYTDQFFLIDPANRPPVGTVLNMVRLELNDVNNNGVIRAGNGDTVGGLVVTAVWQNDTVRVVMGGVTRTITGVTFYRSGGVAVFTPTDGTVLTTATFVSSTYVTSSTQTAVSSLGPACFVRSTLIETPDGPRRIDSLKAGDLVLTRDHGPRKIVWLGRSDVDAMGEHAPIRFEMGSIGNDRPLIVSPLHRILISDWRAQYYFGVEEVFVHAKHLVNNTTIRPVPRAKAQYMHLMLDRHEVVYAHGAASESFYPGDTIMAENPRIRDEVLAIYPALADPAQAWPLARRMLRAHEAMMLAAPPIQLDACPPMGKMARDGKHTQTTAQIIPISAYRRAA